MNRTKKNGFTLVELLAVIVILAIILVIAVPKIMSVIEDAKKATIESTAKMIASAAEKAKVQNAVLGKEKEIECEDVVKLNNIDYSFCIIEFNENKSKVTISGSGKFEGLNVCEGDKTNAIATTETCNLKYGNAAVYISKLSSFDGSANGLIIDDTKDKNIRYVGSNPNNYIYFNCEEKDLNNNIHGSENYDYSSSCEIWRIIGVFNEKIINNQNQRLLKIIKNDSIGKMSWDSSATNINQGIGVNEWSQSDLKEMLNTYYIGESPKCLYCNERYQSNCTKECNDSVNSINNIYNAMIENVIWRTGAIEYKSRTAREMYEAEQSVKSNEKGCSTLREDGSENTWCNDTVERKTEWIGKIGLIYPSDWGYASNDENCTDITDGHGTCNQNNWLNSDARKATILPVKASIDAGYVFGFYNSIHYGDACAVVDVYPTLYLKSNIEIKEGNGSSNNPYILN